MGVILHLPYDTHAEMQVVIKFVALCILVCARTSHDTPESPLGDPKYLDQPGEVGVCVCVLFSK